MLVVEDEPAVRALVGSVLRQRGYTLIEAGSAREAMGMLRDYRGPLHLLVTDVIMPEMTGVELARRVVAERPLTPVLYMSGYADDVLRHEHALPGAAFLQKPFAPETLIERVREMLEITSSAA